MANMVELVERLAGEEEILAVVIGPPSWQVGEINGGKKVPFGKLLSWEQARSYLDFSFNSGYGSPECYALWAWTPAHVISVREYDGATHFFAVPRNPVAELPQMI